ncbi:MAG TPA: HXXEE domain-containing protein [Bacteroidota bacterium]|nr:HXXEE domain-containing protein [Bacteroidota bacterium]
MGIETTFTILIAIQLFHSIENGLWHMVWWGIAKHYVPGLATAPLFVMTFIVYYFQILF